MLYILKASAHMAVCFCRCHAIFNVMGYNCLPDIHNKSINLSILPGKTSPSLISWWYALTHWRSLDKPPLFNNPTLLDEVGWVELWKGGHACTGWHVVMIPLVPSIQRSLDRCWNGMCDWCYGTDFYYTFTIIFSFYFSLSYLLILSKRALI